MDDMFIRKRINELRLSHDMSEYTLSYELGHSKNYINGITFGRTLPSIKELLYICDYFHITPQEFFNEDNKDNPSVTEIIYIIRQMQESDLQPILSILKQVNK